MCQALLNFMKPLMVAREGVPRCFVNIRPSGNNGLVITDGKSDSNRRIRAAFMHESALRVKLPLPYQSPCSMPGGLSHMTACVFRESLQKMSRQRSLLSFFPHASFPEPAEHTTASNLFADSRAQSLPRIPFLLLSSPSIEAQGGA